MAYGHKGDLAQADLASALAAFMRGDTRPRASSRHAPRRGFPIGSPGWVKADDIIGSKAATGSAALTSERTEFHALASTLGSRRRLHADASARSPGHAQSISERAAQRNREDRPRISACSIPRCCRTRWPSWRRGRPPTKPRRTRPRSRTTPRTIFNSPRQVVTGNPQGDVTFVEFFDYNCGYCKRAMTDMFDLMKDDPKLKVVLKEFPVLGPGSVEAAARRGRRPHAGQDRQEVHGFPPEAARRPRPGRQGARDRGRQGGRHGHGAAREATWRATRSRRRSRRA